jgi:hypothetical protein
MSKKILEEIVILESLRGHYKMREERVCWTLKKLNA